MRSKEYLDAARTRLGSARRPASDDPAACLSTAYHAARAALSEKDVQARRHRGAWHEFRQRFVIDGPIDQALVTELQRLQAEREHDDHDAAEIAWDDARAALAAAERFIAAVEAVLQGPTAT